MAGIQDSDESVGQTRSINGISVIFLHTVCFKCGNVSRPFFPGCHCTFQWQCHAHTPKSQHRTPTFVGAAVGAAAA